MIKVLSVAGVGIIFILVLYVVDQIRYKCPYCKTRTIKSTGVTRPFAPYGNIYVCTKCEREFF